MDCIDFSLGCLSIGNHARVFPLGSSVKINPVPFLYQFVGGWHSIQAQVSWWAVERGYSTYGDNPTAYRFEGWGVVGFWPPKLACNVKYFEPGGTTIDAGRFVA